MRQESNQCVSDCITNLTLAIQDCGCKAIKADNFEHAMLVLQLIVGLRNEKDRENLLSQKKDLSWEKACGIASNQKCVRQNLQQLNQSNDGVIASLESEVAVSLVDTAVSSPRQRPPAPSKQLPSCYRCGQHHIRWSDCRHQKTVCQFCKKIGHIERVCFSKRRANTNTHVTYPNPAGDAEAILRMFSANALLQSPYTITLPVDRHPVKFEIDTCSAVTLINEASLQKLPSLLPASSTFRSYTGQNVEVRGVFTVEVEYDGELHYFPVYVDLFRDDSATHYRGPPVKFQFQSDFRSRFFKARTVPYAVAPKVDEELDRLQKADIIEPVQYSEWAAPIIPALKSDGSVHICGNYKLTINSATKLNPYPLQRIEDLYASLAGDHQFTTLYLKHAYNQVVLDTESRDATTINTHRGLFRYKRQPFGDCGCKAIKADNFEHAMLVLQLIVGLRNEKDRENLLSQKKDLSWEKACGIASNQKCVRQNLQQLNQSNDGVIASLESEVAVSLVDTAVSSPRQRPPAPSKQLPSCYRCGQHHIRWSDCRHQKTVCQFCKKIGHIERVCFSKRRANTNTHVTYPNPAGDAEAILRMFSANALLQSPYTITLPVDRHPVKFEIDTCSAVTLINEASLQKLPSLLPASSTFRSYTGQNVEVRGVFTVEVEYDGELHYFPVYVDLFRDDSATHYRGPPVKFQFQSDFRSRFFKARTVPYAVAPKVDEELDRLQKADIIEPVQYSEWAAPIIPALKSDGSVHICGNYKLTINSATKLNPYPLQRIEDLYASLAGDHQFTTLYLKHAYNQVVLDTESRDATTINTHRGLFRYKRQPFGLKLLRTNLGELGQRYFDALNLQKAIDLQTAFTKLESAWGEKDNVFLSRYRFCQMRQESNQCVSDCITNLTLAIQDCGCKAIKADNFEHAMLVLQLIVGLRNEKDRENLLSQKKDLSWEKACGIASNQKCVRQNLQQLNQSNDGVIASLESEVAVSLVDTAVSSPRQRPPAPSKQLPSCYRCGQHHIRWSDCRHQKTVCQFCKKIGHIERVCFSKRRANTNTHVTYPNPAGDAEAILRMFSANALLQSPYTITLPVDRHPVKFEIDTCSAVTLINEASLQKLPSLLPASSTFRCPQSDSPGPVFGGRLTQQAEAPDHSGVPRLLVEMVKALRRRGLCMEGIYRVPGRASRLQEIIQLANSNASELCERLVWDEEEAFDGRALSSAIKRYLGALPVSLLNANMFASFVASTVIGTASERGGRSLRTPAGLANAVCQLRVALMKAFGCPGKATALDLERGWRLATLDFVMRHFREVVALQAINRMSPRALALCLAPSLFGSTDDAEINSQVLELLIEHWPWLSECLLHRGSQPVSADRLGEPLSDACLYACRYQRHCFLQSLCLPPTLPPSSPPPPPPPPPSVDGSTTIFAAYEDIQERQLVVLFLLHRDLDIREDGVELFWECQHLIPFDDDEGIIHIPGPELRFVVLEDQRLLPLQDRLGELIGVPLTCS
ncbi:hypothetical protein SprV_0702417600 [Sparganum proliferum]